MALKPQKVRSGYELFSNDSLNSLNFIVSRCNSMCLEVMLCFQV